MQKASLALYRIGDDIIVNIDTWYQTSIPKTQDIDIWYQTSNSVMQDFNTWNQMSISAMQDFNIWCQMSIFTTQNHKSQITIRKTVYLQLDFTENF